MLLDLLNRCQIRLAATCAILVMAMSFCWAYTCPNSICDTGLMWCQVDCDTYLEGAHVNATTPTSATGHSAVKIDPVAPGSYYYLDNCDNSDQASENYGSGWTDSEALSHTITGTMTSTVGSQLGIDAVVKLTLSHAVSGEGSLSWQKTDTFTNWHTIQWEVIASAHTKKRSCKLGDFKDGAFTKNGYMEWTVNVREICYIGSWDPGYGTCEYTTSNANGNNKVYNNLNTDIDDVSCDGE